MQDDSTGGERGAARPLFVGGPQRSGTTALVHYLNEHPGVLLCMERYKWMHPRHIKPELFTFERILDYRTNPRGDREETNTPWEYHAQLLAGKDPSSLSWLGDKNPAYVRNLHRLSQNNPGALFILTYRPLEEVAESFEARSQDPEDPWRLGGFETGVDYWNIAMRATREFVKRSSEPNALVLSYHDFFYRNEECIPLISRYLDLDFSEAIRERWREMSARFEEERRPKRPLTEEQAAYVRENKDHAAEEWVLGHVGEQWERLERGEKEAERLTLSLGGEPHELAAALARARTEAEDLAERNRLLERRIAGSTGGLEGGSHAAGRLEEQNERLKLRARELERQVEVLRDQLRGIRESRSWRLLEKLNRLRKKAFAWSRRT